MLSLLFLTFCFLLVIIAISVSLYLAVKNNSPDLMVLAVIFLIFSVVIGVSVNSAARELDKANMPENKVGP